MFEFALCWGIVSAAVGVPPNILMIVADDYGYNDVGYHGSELSTPAIDALASEGVKLENYYVLPMCTPTRSALLTGRYPMRTGLQTSTISPAKPYGMHMNYSTLAEELQARDYKTHMIGKWHLGFCREGFMPHKRGFDSFDGYVNGAEEYFTHIRSADRVSFDNFTSGFDYYSIVGETTKADAIAWAKNATGPQDNVNPAAGGDCYSAHDLTATAVAIVDSHHSTRPLFMYLAYQSVHSPYEAPQLYIDQYAWMNDTVHYTPTKATRPLYGGMVAALDEGVANITNAFRAKDKGAFWENTLLVFTTDNGGIGPGNNYPLRGRKLTLWEGGTRAVGFIRGPGLGNVAGTTNVGMMHVVDWLPTLLSVVDRSIAAVGTRVRSSDRPAKTLAKTLAKTMSGIDGLDMWTMLSSGNASSSPRTEFVYNIEPNVDGVGILGGAVRVGCYKIIHGSPGTGMYDPMPQPRPVDAVPTFKPLVNATYARTLLSETMGIGRTKNLNGSWLFDLCTDPNETTNLYNSTNSTLLMAIQVQLEERLLYYTNMMVPAMYNEYSDDYRMDPSLNNGTWTWIGCTAD